MKHVRQDQIEEFRVELEAEKDSLEEELTGHGRVQDEAGDWMGKSESEGEEPDPIDAADNIEELVTNVPLVEDLEVRHKAVEAALERIESGLYGICEECGEEIPLKRLEANPAAATCIKHTG